MSAYSDSVSEPVFSEPDSVSAKKNIETEVEIGFFRPFPSVFIANPDTKVLEFDRISSNFGEIRPFR
jgi:hypothetical protein